LGKLLCMLRPYDPLRLPCRRVLAGSVAIQLHRERCPRFIERGALADQCFVCPGFDGAIATNEAYIYCLDSLPLFIGLGVFCIYYPPRFLPQSSFIKGAASYSLELGQREPEKTYGSQ
jgi:hypothetical protein